MKLLDKLFLTQISRYGKRKILHDLNQGIWIYKLKLGYLPKQLKIYYMTIAYFLKFGFNVLFSLVMRFYGGPFFFKKIASDQKTFNFRKIRTNIITELKI